MAMVEVITKHKCGDPSKKEYITWVEFMVEVQPESEKEIHKIAIDLLFGNILHASNGFTYFLTGINLRD